MRRIVVAWIALAWASPAAAQQVKVESFVLENGMEFLLVPRHDQPNSVACGWVAKVGSVNERPGITGISHFFEHMMFKGTRTIGTRDAARDRELSAAQEIVRGKLRALHLGPQYARWKSGEIDDPWKPEHDSDEMAALRTELKTLMEEQKKITVANEFDKVYTDLGGDRMNAFTNNDMTFYFITVPSNKLELWAWMESDRLADSTFREFYQERDVVHEERRLRTDSTPTGIFDEQFEAIFWQSSPYAWPVVGWPHDLNSYTREQAESYYESYYAPNNLVGILVGDFDAAAARPVIERYFGGLARGAEPPAVVTLEMPQLAEVTMRAEGDCQPQAQVRYHTVPFGHPDQFALEVLARLLNGRSGRLQKEIVEGKEVAAEAQALSEQLKYAGWFAFVAECKGDATPEQLVAAWDEEVAKLEQTPAAAQELDKVKNQTLADSYRRLESNFFLMLQLGMYEALGGWEFINDSPARLAAVTAEQVMEAAKTYLTPTNRAVALYTRKPGTATEDDSDLAALPARQRQEAKAVLQQIHAIQDAAQLREMRAQVEKGRAEMPAEYQAFAALILARVDARLEQLEVKQP